MKLFTHLLLLAAALTACGGADTSAAHASQAARDAAQSALASSTTSPTASTAPMKAPTPPPATPYTVRGVIDPGLHNMIAFAFKVPRGWQLTQDFQRKWNGAQPVPQITLQLLAPSGQQIRFLPEQPYYYQDGPTSRSLREQAASMGLPMPRRDEYELPVMTPLVYIRQVLLPGLAQQGLRVQTTAAHEQPSHATGTDAYSASGYVDGRLPNGQAMRVECLINAQARNMGGELYYNWSVRPSLTLASPAELAATFAHTQAARQSFVTNPAWLRQVQVMAQQGQQSNFEVTQRDQAAYQAYQQHQQQLNDRVSADRQRSQDQIAKVRGDLLRGKTEYDNTATSERYRVDDRYNHVYQDRNGALHGSNVALDAAALNWQELQQVELGNY